MEITLNEKQLFDIFSWGIDYGQYTMEEERAGEEFSDAFQGFIVDAKFSMPSYPVQNRQLHSDEWFKEKSSGLTKYTNFIADYLTQEQKK